MIITTLLLCSCLNKSSIYSKEVNELKNITISSIDNPLNIKIEIEKINEELYIYRSLIDRNNEELYDVKALLVHNKDTDDIFPSIGIIDESIDVIEGKGIKLSGYVTDINNIIFKLMIRYVNKEGNEVKYYYVDNSSTNNL